MKFVCKSLVVRLFRRTRHELDTKYTPYSLYSLHLPTYILSAHVHPKDRFQELKIGAARVFVLPSLGRSFIINSLKLYFMAKIPFGILGPIIGSMGPVTGKMWKTKATLSAHRNPAKTDENPTPAQLNQRTKFGFVSKFLNGMGPLVKKSFQELAIDHTGFQTAVSYNMCNAVSGAYPDYVLHHNLVSVGRGTLPNAVLPEAKAGDAPGDIRFIWADNTGIGTAASTDRAIAAVYIPGQGGGWEYNELSMAKRSDCSLVFNLRSYKGLVHTWLVFISDEDKKASDSVYTGTVVVG